jgi:hypothetical protein
MNSLKSVSSFAKSTSMPFDQFEQNIEALLRRQVCVELIVGAVSRFEAVEDSRDAIHREKL